MRVAERRRRALSGSNPRTDSQATARRVQALVLSPTRELALQTEKVVLALGEFMNVQAHACVGGKSIGEDIRKLDHGVHIVSGTPGRVFDMVKRRNLRTRAIKVLVLVRLQPTRGTRLGLAHAASRVGAALRPVAHAQPRRRQDEADEMLSKGFKEQIYDVYRYLPPETQVVLVSATLPHEVLEITGKFMTDPLRVLVKRDELTLEGIKQFFVGACARVSTPVACAVTAAARPGAGLVC